MFSDLANLVKGRREDTVDFKLMQILNVKAKFRQ